MPQTVKCKIESCTHNTPDHHCSLKAITVCPCGCGCDGVKEKSGSMCASFDEKKSGLF